MRAWPGTSPSNQIAPGSTAGTTYWAMSESSSIHGVRQGERRSYNARFAAICRARSGRPARSAAAIASRHLPEGAGQLGVRAARLGEGPRRTRRAPRPAAAPRTRTRVTDRAAGSAEARADPLGSSAACSRRPRPAARRRARVWRVSRWFRVSLVSSRLTHRDVRRSAAHVVQGFSPASSRRSSPKGLRNARQHKRPPGIKEGTAGDPAENEFPADSACSALNSITTTTSDAAPLT